MKRLDYRTVTVSSQPGATEINLHAPPNFSRHRQRNTRPPSLQQAPATQGILAYEYADASQVDRDILTNDRKSWILSRNRTIRAFRKVLHAPRDDST